VLAATIPETVVNTDEWKSYDRLPYQGRARVAVNHRVGEYARDDDGDGIREVHVNTLEGLWTGLRNFLRPFRGVHKKYLYQYVAIFEWRHNLKSITSEFLTRLLAKQQPISSIAP